MWYELFQTVLAPAVLLFASLPAGQAGAADIPAPPLPINFTPATLVSSRLLAVNFSNEPRLAQAPPGEGEAGEPQVKVEALLINRKTCAEAGYHLTYRIVVRNRSPVPIFDVVVQNQYPAGTTFTTANRPPDEHNPLGGPLIWREGFLPPGAFVSYTFTVRVDALPGQFVNNLLVTFLPAEGAPQQVLSDHVVAAGCPGFPAILPLGRPAKQPAIICDPAEVGCVGILPDLGVNFKQAAADPQKQVRICDPNDPRGCAPNRPALGVRFNEAIADIIPGDCRVLSDDIIVTPDFQDALNRRAQPAAFYLVPLHNAGENFKRLALENVLLGIRHTRRAQTLLTAADTASAVAGGLLTLEEEYVDMQQQRKDKFDPIAEEAINQAIESIQRACGGDQGNHQAVLQLRQAWPTVKQAYEANLDLREQAYRNMQQVFLQQSPAGSRQAFDALFERTFVAHQKEDEVSDSRIRLEQWEVALDIPKAAATECEAENVFASRVETGWCESNNYAQILVEGAPLPEKAKLGLIAPPDLADINAQAPFAVLQEALTKGVACGGKPGDPWWAADCSCQCGEVAPGPEGTLRTCQDAETGETKQITRHDIFVTSQAECLADGPKHIDPFF